MDCIFCKILAGEIPANIIYKDEQVVAIDDLYPKAPYHKLIISRKHIPTLNDLTEEDSHIVGKMAIAAQTIAKKLDFDEHGYRIVMNCNAGAGQTVFHIHMHLLGGRDMNWPPG